VSPYAGREPKNGVYYTQSPGSQFIVSEKEETHNVRIMCGARLLELSNFGGN
jgi:hypothetical protein